MGKMIYEPKHRHKHNPPHRYNGKLPLINSIWQCECGQQFKYRRYFAAPSDGRWKKIKTPKPKPVSRGIGICNIDVPDDWEPPSAAIITSPRKTVKTQVSPKRPVGPDEVQSMPAYTEVRVTPKITNHHEDNYNVKNVPQYRYVSDWFDGTIEGDRNYQKFEMRVYRG